MTAVVTVTYNSARTLARCLEATRGLHHVVVDNASSDGSADIARGFPHAEVVRSSRNLGFASAANWAIELAAPEDVLLLNPDAYLEASTLMGLETSLRSHPLAAIVAPRLRNVDGTIQPSARTFPSPLTMLIRRSILGRTQTGQRLLHAHLMASMASAEVVPVDWVLGAASLIRREALDAVGGFDTRFFLYGEDVDLCYRLWASNWQILLVPGVTVVHEYARASRRTWNLVNPATRHHWRSAARLFAKHPRLIVGSSPRNK